MHAALVLREEVFAVEVVRLAGWWCGCAGSGGGRSCQEVGGTGLVCVDAALAHVAAVEAELEMLGGDVSLPLVLRDECARASV